MRNRWLALLLALLAAFVLTACSDDEPTDEELTDGPPSEAPAETSEAPAEEGTGDFVELKFNVWDDTVDRPIEGTPELVLEGEDPWRPDLSKKADANTMGSVEVGTNLEFSFYPAGTDGQEVTASIFIDPELIPPLEEPLDVIIYIEDDIVLIESGFVGFSEEFPRE